MPVPTRVNKGSSVEFVADQFANGRRFRVLNIVDDYSRDCVAQIIDFSMSGLRLALESDRLAASRKLPKTVVCDNEPELTWEAMFVWSGRHMTKLHFVWPGKPTQNAFVESDNGKFRECCLNLHCLKIISDARSTIEDWRQHYNHVRPHRSPGRKPPALFARKAA